MKLPKENTNPRGVEITGEAMRALVRHRNTLSIPINWRKDAVEFNPYNRWVEMWSID